MSFLKRTTPNPETPETCATPDFLNFSCRTSTEVQCEIQRNCFMCWRDGAGPGRQSHHARVLGRMGVRRFFDKGQQLRAIQMGPCRKAPHGDRGDLRWQNPQCYFSIKFWRKKSDRLFAHTHPPPGSVRGCMPGCVCMQSKLHAMWVDVGEENLRCQFRNRFFGAKNL